MTSTRSPRRPWLLLAGFCAAGAGWLLGCDSLGDDTPAQADFGGSGMVPVVAPFNPRPFTPAPTQPMKGPEPMGGVTHPSGPQVVPPPSGMRPDIPLIPLDAGFEDYDAGYLDDEDAGVGDADGGAL